MLKKEKKRSVEGLCFEELFGIGWRIEGRSELLRVKGEIEV
jgi:hypothetical protein